LCVGDNLPGNTELKKVTSAKIPYEDGVCDKACAAKCIYFWPDPAADLKDNLSDIQSK
jgi:hypothetical protein